MIKILAVLLLAIAGFYLGYKLYKSNKENDQTVSMYATLTMICTLVNCIVLISYLLLKGSPWTGENKVLMRYILVLLGCILCLFGRKAHYSRKKRRRSIDTNCRPFMGVGDVAGFRICHFICFQNE